MPIKAASNARPHCCQYTTQTLSNSSFNPAKGVARVSHEKRIVTCSCPQDRHALDGIPVLPRAGHLDVVCADCRGHGQWNREIDLISHRSKRHVCESCDGRGWIETGDDMVSAHDVVMSPEGHPQWVTRLDPPRSID
jgi:hypothetical protein